MPKQSYRHAMSRSLCILLSLLPSPFLWNNDSSTNRSSTDRPTEGRRDRPTNRKTVNSNTNMTGQCWLWKVAWLFFVFVSRYSCRTKTWSRVCSKADFELCLYTFRGEVLGGRWYPSKYDPSLPASIIRHGMRQSGLVVSACQYSYISPSSLFNI